MLGMKVKLDNVFLHVEDNDQLPPKIKSPDQWWDPLKLTLYHAIGASSFLGLISLSI